MTKKALFHAKHKKFNKTHKKINPRGVFEKVVGKAVGIGVNKLSDFAGSHQKTENIQHIHKDAGNIHRVSEKLHSTIGDPINNLIPISINKKYKKNNPFIRQ